MSELEDFVVCRVCGDHYKEITVSHLKRHGWTMEQYRREFPAVPIWSNISLKKSADGRRGKPHPSVQGDRSPLRRYEHLRQQARERMLRDPIAKRPGVREKMRGPRPSMAGNKNPMCRPEVQAKAQLWRDTHPEKVMEIAMNWMAASPLTNTKCEKALLTILDELEATWRPGYVGRLVHHECRHPFDAVILEYKGEKLEICFEADGCWWHQCLEHYPTASADDNRVERNVRRDKEVNGFCKQLKIPLYRFWEHDLLKRPEWVKQQVFEILEKAIECVQVKIGGVSF